MWGKHETSHDWSISQGFSKNIKSQDQKPLVTSYWALVMWPDGENFMFSEYGQIRYRWIALLIGNILFYYGNSPKFTIYEIWGAKVGHVTLKIAQKNQFPNYCHVWYRWKAHLKDHIFVIGKTHQNVRFTRYEASREHLKIYKKLNLRK